MSNYDDHKCGPAAMTDVPSSVWDSVYEKWRRAYLDGWSYGNLWYGCDLCRFMADGEYMCIECPLYINNWCRTYGRESKISIQYHTAIGDPEDEAEWSARLRDFLIFLKPYCTGGYYDSP